MNLMEYCPCGTTHRYEDCCGVFHRSYAAPNAEALMRSRYTAYVMGNVPYLMATWHFSSRPTIDALNVDANSRWMGLEIKRTLQEGTSHAVVEFVARYKVNGRAHRLHETSRFVNDSERWFYVDGDIHTK